MIRIGFSIVIFLFVFGCKIEEDQSYQNSQRALTAEEQQQEEIKKLPLAQQVLIGTHPLRKILESKETKTKLSAGFFLFMGGFDGEKKTDWLVKFAWEMNDGTYAISSLPIEKIRIRFNNEIAVPTVEFRVTNNIWHESSYCSNQDLQELIGSGYVSCVVITVKESDWPAQINLPLN